MVTIVIPTCFEKNQLYLDAALESVRNLNYPKDRLDVIVVASNGFIPKVPNFSTLYAFEKRMHFSEAVNTGFSHANPESKYYFILSDDCVLTKTSLSSLVFSAADNDVIMGPISNCENTLRYSLRIGFKTPDGREAYLPDRTYRLEQLEKYLFDMMNSDSYYPPGSWQVEYVCFFAVLIPKKVWDKVGKLDERFKSGQEDTDYCARAKSLGIPIAVNINSLIFHFGGVTADQILTQDDRDESLKHFFSKYPDAKLNKC